MGTFQAVRQLLAKFETTVGWFQSDPEFLCGDCEIVDRCGRPPTADCIEKLEQIERNPNGSSRRLKNDLEIQRLANGGLPAKWPDRRL